MSRKRMIAPTIWEDPSFNKLSIQARLLFIGMFSNADDEGYLRADTGGLKRLVFGFDEIKQDEIVVWRGEVSGIMKNIHFFENNGEEYAHFLNWGKFQKQQKDRIIASVYPKCSKCLATATQLLTEVKESKVKISKDNIYIYPEDFEKFWLAYPEKSGKKTAYRSWLKIKPDKNLLNTILQAIEVQKKGRKWIEGYIKNPATWLNGECWEDKVEVKEPRKMLSIKDYQ